ncbi:hypothetical protein EO087_01855 [Dyella sp. M7H15-1]|uniref:hypothetical protein n=1 Tax=Dyella sp. M7H15-1 TaxID=2501295 RepID=UPI001004E184|nr:hypothetical protein [Dyella sp. M7H15-1]QAU22884.1 hypothetical protein EO087_01855 [Dyella sp. M7H15-1]
MADLDTHVTLDALHAAMREQLAEQFPGFRLVAFYREDESEKLPAPACLLELTEIEPAPVDDAGTGQFPALLRWEAHVVLGFADPAVQLEVRKAAAALATWLHLRRWKGIRADACQVIGCYKDEFKPGLDRYAVWTVEWVQWVFLGESAWDNDGVIPEHVYFSFAPDVGEAHRESYQPAVPDER